MARVKIDPLAPRATTSRRTDHVLRDTRWGPIVQKWPRPRGAAKSGYNYFREQEFKIAAQWASDPNPLEYETAILQTKGTEMVPRDLIMSASFGLAYQIYDPDGNLIEADRNVNPNAQSILDQVTNVVGSMIYRADLGWIAVPPGVNGQALLNTAGAPSWQTIPGGIQNPSLNWQLLNQSGVPTSNPTTWTWSANTQTVDVIGLALYHEISVMFTGVTTAASTTRSFRFSSDNGATFFAGANDYTNWALTGAPTNATALGMVNPNTAGACDGAALIIGWNQPTPKIFNRVGDNVGGRCNVAQSMNALRLTNTAPSNMTAGKLYVWGR